MRPTTTMLVPVLAHVLALVCELRFAWSRWRNETVFHE